MTQQLIDHLSQFISERRLALFETVLSQRTNYMTVVLEDIFQPHNASAVLRSSECFGLQDVHIIENSNPYRINPDVALGSYKWLNIFRYNIDDENTLSAITKLKSQGYRIVATSPHKKSCNLEDFDITKGKFALLFGTELKGLSQVALNEAGEYLRIPMAGFTESLNISVTAAICIHHLTNIIRANENVSWQLANEYRNEIKLEWLRKSIKRSDLIEKAFLERYRKENKDI